MNFNQMAKMFCPWTNRNCLVEECMACSVHEEITEDINGDPVMICLRAEDIRMRLWRG